MTSAWSAENCDRVAVMYAGEVVESGTAKEIFLGEKHHPYTQGLFGTICRISTTRRAGFRRSTV